MESLRITATPELFAPAESSYFEGSFELPCLKAGSDLYTFPRPLEWQVSLTNTGDAFLVLGSVEGVAQVSCARCLDTYELPLLGEVEGYFLVSKEVAAPEGLDADEYEILPADNVIDLEPLLLSALLLEVPLIPLCDDACRGLCSICGVNKNTDDCSCGLAKDTGQSDDKPNPFSILKEYPFQDKS